MYKFVRHIRFENTVLDIEQELTDDRYESNECPITDIDQDHTLDQYLGEYLRSFPEFKDCNFEVEIVQANDSDSITEKTYCNEYGEPLQDAAHYIGAAERYTIPSELSEQYIRADTDIDARPSYSSTGEQLIYGRSGDFHYVDPVNLMKQMSQDYQLASPEEELKEIEWRDEFGKPYQPDFCGNEIGKSLNANMSISDVPETRDFHNHNDGTPLHIYEPHLAQNDVEYGGQTSHIYKIPPMPTHNLPSYELHEQNEHIIPSPPPNGITRRSQLTIGPLGTTYLRSGPDQTKLTSVFDKPSVRNNQSKPNADNVLPNQEDINNVNLASPSTSRNEALIDKSIIKETNILPSSEPIIERTNTVQELTKKFSQTTIADPDRERKMRVISPSAMQHVEITRNQQKNEGSETNKKTEFLSVEPSFETNYNDTLSEKREMPTNSLSYDDREKNHHSSKSERRVHNGRIKNGREKSRSFVNVNSDRSKNQSNREYVRSPENTHKAHHRNGDPRLSHSLRNVQIPKSKRHRKRNWSPQITKPKSKQYCYINGEKYKVLDLSKGGNKTGKQSTIAPSFYSTAPTFIQSPPTAVAQPYGNYQTFPPYDRCRHSSYKHMQIPNDNDYWSTFMQMPEKHKLKRMRKDAAFRNGRSKTIHELSAKDNMHYNSMSRKMQEHAADKRDYLAAVMRSTVAQPPNVFYPPVDARFQNAKYRGASSMPLYQMFADNHMMFDNMPDNTYYNHSLWS